MRDKASSAPCATPGTSIVVFGERASNRGIAEELALDGFDVKPAGDREFLRACCRPGDVDVVIFARGSDTELLAALRELRAGALAPDVSPATNVLWIARGERDIEVLRAFDAGSDDVIRTPLHHRELLARIGALTRRTASATTPAVVRHRDLAIDVAEHTVTFDAKPVALRRLEYDLLLYLARSPRRVFTKNELLSDVWGFRSPGATRTVDSHASRLRQKLTAVGAAGWIVNIWGVGYALT
jgi:DNA-binding response OmpR family regulator